MLYPVLQDPLRPIVSSLFDRPVGVNIRQMLFGAGEQGGWYDVSDMSTLFQDEAGTTPVTAVEQPVGLMLDKSGRGNHATQATTTKRPVLKIDAGGCYYLSFDGVDDALQTGNIDFTGTDKMTVWAGVTKLSDAADGTLYMCGEPTSTQNGSFRVDAPGSSTVTKYQVAVRGTAISVPYTDSATYNAPNTTVFTQVSDIGADIAQMRLGGVLVDSRTTDQGTGNYGNYPMYIGARTGTSVFFNGRLYGLIVRGAQSSLSQIEATELYVKRKMRLP